MTIGLLPDAGQAAPVQPVTAPKTASEAAQKVQELGEQLEVLSEEVNGAGIRVAKLRVASLAATRQAVAADRRYATLSVEVGKIVRTTYTTAPFGQFTTLMTSDSPQDFLEQLSTLERMSEQHSRTISSVLRVKQQVDQARDKARKALAAAHHEYAAAVAKKKRLDQQIVQYKAIYARLSAQERAQLYGGTASRSGRTPIGNLPPMSGRAKIAVDTALAQRGDPYVWGAAGPDAFDCSGLTMYAWGKAGVSLPHQSAEQYGFGTHVPTDLAYLKPGDLLFFYSPIHHVAIYIGNGQQVHAPTSGDVVRVAPVDWPNLVGATRLS